MRSWCFDSQAVTNGGVTTYDREYGSADIREVVGKLIGNGVYATPATNMQVVADSGMVVKVQPGCCWINGAFGAVDTAESFTLDASSGERVDLIVARFDTSLSYRSVRLLVIKGTDGSTAAPALIRTASICDIQLAKINVRSGAASILQSDITDTRYDGTVCGIVTGVINQIDVTNLFTQYQTSFNSFMDELESTLSGDVAGNLLVLINNHKNDTSNPHSVTKSDVGLGNVENERQYSASNKPTKNDVGLSNLVNERQYSASNKPTKNDVGLSNLVNELQYSASNRPSVPFEFEIQSAETRTYQLDSDVNAVLIQAARDNSRYVMQPLVLLRPGDSRINVYQSGVASATSGNIYANLSATRLLEVVSSSGTAVAFTIRGVALR